jgi:aspartate/methionine/tyrosine aminotransferase
MTSLNAAFAQLDESATVALADRVRKMRASGTEVVGLQTGDPDFPTPAPIVEAAFRGMRDGQTHYCDSRGLPALREAIAESLRASRNIEFSPGAEILVTTGGVHAYFCALQAILNADEEVLVPDPTWMTHANLVRALRGRPVRVPAFAEDRFWPTLPAWRAALTPRTRALVICSPNNPSGMIATSGYLTELLEFALANRLYIISDEVYDNIVFDGRAHCSIASLPGAAENTLLINSFSKTFAMTGWRIGYLAAPARLISQAVKASQNSVTCVAPFIQLAAVEALTNREVANEVARMSAAYATRRNRVLELRREHGTSPIALHKPEGAFYFFLDIRRIGLSSSEAAERALKEAAVALVPGSAFGRYGEGFLRMTIAAADESVETGFRRLLQWGDSAGPVEPTALAACGGASSNTL